MKPDAVIRLHFANSNTVCLGSQVAEVVATVGRIIGAVTWYAADVAAMGKFSEHRNHTPAPIGSSEDLACLAREVPQFESGVFIAVPDSIKQPLFRDGGVWTDDEEGADMGDGIAEIRAFDSSYIEVASATMSVCQEVARHFGQDC